MRRIIFILTFITLTPILSFAQVTEHAFWTAIFNNTKLNDKWTLQTDVQFRSANEVKNLRHILIRPALLYNINKTNNVGLGYVMFDTFTHSAAPNTTEHRIYEQFVHMQAIKAATIQHRFRMEQRFIERPGMTDLFAQRFRYFARAIIPLQKQEGAFKKGPYTALMNEIFINLQNKDQVNGSLFDQNRASATIGYRFSTKFDIEAGYTNQFVKRTNNTLTNNILQLNIFTRF